MRLAAVITFLLFATFLVSAKPTTSVEEQSRGISLPHWPQIPKPFCMPMLCAFPCMCGSEPDTRGCDTCYCRSCGSEW